MNRHTLLLLSVSFLAVFSGCALQVYHPPMRSATFRVLGPTGKHMVREATPEEIAFLDAWLKRSIDRPKMFGKTSTADVEATMIVLLPTPAELYLQVGREEVVVYRKGAYRYSLNPDEMAEFRRALGFPPAQAEQAEGQVLNR